MANLNADILQRNDIDLFIISRDQFIDMGELVSKLVQSLEAAAGKGFGQAFVAK